MVVVVVVVVVVVLVAVRCAGNLEQLCCGNVLAILQSGSMLVQQQDCQQSC